LTAQRLLLRNPGDVEEMRITQDDEHLLSSTDDLDAETHAYVSESFQLFNKLLEKSDPTDIGQIESYLESLSQADRTFKCRILNDANGNPGVISIIS
jgi:hypothetical protein